MYCNTVGMCPNWCASAEPALLSPVAGRIEMLEALQVTVGIPWHLARIRNGQLSPVLHMKAFAPKPSGSCSLQTLLLYPALIKPVILQIFAKRDLWKSSRAESLFICYVFERLNWWTMNQKWVAGLIGPKKKAN